MILWINGAFGSGKSTAARIINLAIRDSFIYDPENIGYFIRKNQPAGMNTPDFQDEPLWRSFNFKMLENIARHFDGLIIVPMTLRNPDYYKEIIGKLRSAGIDVRHYLLLADKEVVAKRLRKRLEGANSWAARQTVSCIEGFKDAVFENQINTNRLSAKQAAALIMSDAGLRIREKD